ncbi:FKBP-type peptidyl-prolyl cis-trans isomerase [Rubrivirga sp. S365]|uniref:Peptidyl-prolyl cis-trans isomerase n=1 Tax=Rubrivirga litoralis TaxID=3075598 RepID=A0ABU3BM06_9BACT|nr:MULTISPECIES: FKBP-type peptidyl-prolyl cis-trans isomerase [unclassified Rubrivirga]MDT0630324.1 FKBP-type peptidyl-prolyl cis-trans isomerase [Rubrivirga sp. F394]MDT7855836.1 FKBP-type peptidyl-prolyl cis-trans isomerase [Rubrivirga sp. S365]
MRRLAFPSLASAGLLLVLALPVAPALTGCDSSDPVSCDAGGELDIVDTTPEGTRLGARITATDCVYLTYEGRLDATGEAFDRNERAPLSISGTVPGFQQAVVGRRVGESVRVTIPPTLGYGARRRDSGPLGVEIPSCSTLQFDVTIGDTAPPSVCENR